MNDPGSSISLAVSIVLVATLLLVTSGTTLMTVLYWQRCCSTKSKRGKRILFALCLSHYLAAGETSVSTAETTAAKELEENSNPTTNPLDNPLYSSTEVPDQISVSFDNTYAEPWDNSAISISLKNDYNVTQTDVPSSATKTSV